MLREKPEWGGERQKLDEKYRWVVASCVINQTVIGSKKTRFSANKAICRDQARIQFVCSNNTRIVTSEDRVRSKVGNIETQTTVTCGAPTQIDNYANLIFSFASI